MNPKKDVKKIVKNVYSEVAKGKCCCGSLGNKDISKQIGYSDKEMNNALDANLGLGCGNPVAMARLEQGDVVLDLGSGAGMDCFLAAKKVGNAGRIIGIDMTDAMIARAKKNAEKYGYKNVEFMLGDIENLPVDDNSIDAIISNCVINLAPDKSKVFREAYRVLKKSGRLYVSDMVLLKELTEEQRNNDELLAGCVAGAILKKEYLTMLKKAGFAVKILSEDKKISKKQYLGLPVESIKIEAVKQ